jgi:hydrogenase maturation factor
MDWLDRVRIGQFALKIASKDLLDAGIAVRLSSVNALFTSEMELNEASTMVQRMMSLCQEAL